MSLLQIRLLLTPALLLLSFAAFAAPKVSMEVIAEKEIIEVDKKGKKTTKRVIADDTIPGDELFYTIRYRNSGDEPAAKVQLDNPIPKGAVYKVKSAWGNNSNILFSVDGGKTYKKPSSLTYEVKGADGKSELREVSPEQYRAIRWVIEQIPQNSEGSVGFSVLVQ